MRGQTFVTSNYSGGVNKESAPYAIDANQARDALNMNTSTVGTVRKRNGFVSLGIPARVGRSLGTYERGNTRYLIVFGDNGSSTTIESMTPAGSFTNRKGAATVTPGKPWDCIQAPISGGQGPAYFINGTDPVLQWTGTGDVAAWTATSGAVPNGKYMVYASNRVMIAGVETDYVTRSTLYASGIADPRVWAVPSAVTTQFDPDDGQEITGLGVIGPYPLVFKPRKTFAVTDVNSLAYRRISSEKGCVSHRSIAASQVGTFFLSADKTVCLTDGSRIQVISNEVNPILKTIPTSSLTQAAATFKDDRYLLSVATAGGENDTILEFDTLSQSWWVHKIYMDLETTEAVADWALLDPGGDSILYGSGNTSGSPRIYQCFVDGVWEDRGGTVDDPVVYPAYYITGWASYGEPHLRKIVTQVRVDAKGEYNFYDAKHFSSAFALNSTDVWELSEEGFTEFGVEDTFGGGGVFGDKTAISERRFYTPGVARSWSFKFESDDSREFEIYSHTVGVEMRTD